MSSPGVSPSQDPARRAALYAPFRPRLARVVALVLAALVVVLTPVLVLNVPGEYGFPDLVGFALVGVAIAWFCWRQASVRAVPDERGLLVRNLLLSRRLAWAEIVSVRFGQGRPWVQLDLADGDTLAVMGVQRADGGFANAEARRMASLVAIHTRTPRDD
ncbi:PH domain-containing protein [Cellulomonas fimi]|uniref:PH domain-containing protein n=1 Tax=Cellulomonas fimi TaxID=1708 RepID=A0A7Y0QJ34_CELFI|nr:PH domain-containing protein [Cellulomonas fimi]NMR21524.1 PH domain-containing protein [Cellulomonas fimi]